MQRGYNDTVEEQVAAYKPLVVKIAKQIRSRLPASFRLEDLIQDGMIGLLDAISKYAPRSDIPFDNYASFRIRGAIYDGCRALDILPRGVREKEESFKRAAELLEQTLGRVVTAAEIARHLQITLEEYLTTVDSFAYYSFVDDGQLQALAGDADPFGSEEFASLKIKISETLKRLSSRQQQVLSLHYEYGMSYRDIAAALEITAGRVCQLHSEAIKEIRNQL